MNLGTYEEGFGFSDFEYLGLLVIFDRQRVKLRKSWLVLNRFTRHNFQTFTETEKIIGTELLPILTWRLETNGQPS